MDNGANGHPILMETIEFEKEVRIFTPQIYLPSHSVCFFFIYFIFMICGFVFIIIIDKPEGLPVPNISSSPNAFPLWKVYNEDHVEALFEFCRAYLKDDACILVFMPRVK